MFNFIIVLFAVGSALGSTLEPIALRKLRQNPLFPDGRIVGGVETHITEIPYQVALMFHKFQFCGGSLISETHVVTAAHCLESISVYDLRVRVGSSKAGEGGTVIKSARKFPHPKYDDMTIDYDIGMIVLAEKAPIGPGVKPIPVSEVEAPVNSKLRISGWGRTSEGGPQPVQLLSVYIPVIPRVECEKIYENIKGVTNRMICACEAGKDSCQGDSGGPAAVDGKLYGIVSWGRGCARPGYAGVYTNVGDKEIREFIRKHAKV